MSRENEDLPDQHLIAEAQAGNARSFELLFDRYYAMIHAFAYRVCLAETEAEDIAQETFIRAARGLAAYRGEASFKNWLFRIAHHALIDWKRQIARRHDGQARLENEMITREQIRSADFSGIHTALRQLAPELREAVALVYFEEMNHRDAARAMGCAETTVSWRIFRARNILRTMLAQPAEAAS